MPLINFSYRDLCSLIGKDVPMEVLMERIPLMGADMHDTEGDSDEMGVEFFPDRPDLFSVEGLARALRPFLGIEPGMKEYDVHPTDIRMAADPSVRNVRPHIACAAVSGLRVTDGMLRSLMEMQEKLHLTIGRKRAKVAIGIHDLDRVRPPFVYKAVPPKSVSFVPLGGTEPMDLSRILKAHEKGKEYAHLLNGRKRYPVILDADGNVLSFPPIINGALTAVTTGTRSVFIDVTGTDLKAVKGSLGLIATALAERGGRIGSVSMTGAADASYPDLEPSQWTVRIDDCERFLGTDLGGSGIVGSLERMGMDAVTDGGSVHVTVPATRLDMMHPVDIYEDVAIGHGFERFGGSHDLTQTPGELSAATKISETLRDVAIGLGFTEVTTLTLSSEKDEFGTSGLPERDVVTLLNPITEDHTCLRSSLMPSLMRILRRNRHRDLPQNIFEIGDVVRNAGRQRRICLLSASSKASFTESKSVAESILREMRIDHVLRPCRYRTFVDGRAAEIISEGEVMGYFGEMDPRVITDHEIEHPVIMIEMDLSRFIERAARGVI